MVANDAASFAINNENIERLSFYLPSVFANSQPFSVIR